MIHVTISINFGRPGTANSDCSEDSDNDDKQKNPLEVELENDLAMVTIMAQMDAESDSDGKSEYPPTSPKDKAACPCHVAFLMHVCSFAVVILLCMYVAEFTTKLI